MRTTKFLGLFSISAVICSSFGCSFHGLNDVLPGCESCYRSAQRIFSTYVSPNFLLAFLQLFVFV